MSYYDQEFIGYFLGVLFVSLFALIFLVPML